MIASESVEKRNVYEPGEITGARSIFDRLAQNRIPYYSYSYHCGTDRKILQSFRRDLEARAASFFFVYLSEFDGFLHRQVQDAGRVDTTVGRYAGARSATCPRA